MFVGGGGGGTSDGISIGISPRRTPMSLGEVSALGAIWAFETFQPFEVLTAFICLPVPPDAAFYAFTAPTQSHTGCARPAWSPAVFGNHRVDSRFVYRAESDGVQGPMALRERSQLSHSLPEPGGP